LSYKKKKSRLREIISNPKIHTYHLRFNPKGVAEASQKWVISQTGGKAYQKIIIQNFFRCPKDTAKSTKT
jgi:hypothetical protein